MIHVGRRGLRPGLIFDLGGEAGLEVLGSGPKRLVRCPFHDDRNPSAFLSEANVFFCSVCTPDGGWTAKRFAQELGLHWSPRNSEAVPVKRPRRPATAPRFTRADAERLWEAARARARDDDAVETDQQVYRYVASRGLAESWEEPGFGVLGPDMDLPAGVVWWPRCGYRLLLPLFDQQGCPASVQARCIDAAADRKVLFPKGSHVKGSMFANSAGVDLLQNRQVPAKAVFLGEGLTDFLAVACVARIPVISSPGTSLAAAAVGTWASGRRVIVGMDRDEVGRARADALVPLLYEARSTAVFVVVWPEGCLDACEVVLRIGLVGLEDFIRAELNGVCAP